MPVNKYKLEFDQFNKVQAMQNLGNVYPWVPLFPEENAQNRLRVHG